MKLPRDFDFTQSNLQNYVDCPYRFYLRYGLRLKWPALLVDEALKFEQHGQLGARFHQLVQQYLLEIPQDRLDALAAADPDPKMQVWWENFINHVPDSLTGRKFVETILTSDLAGQRIAAKYDLVLFTDDSQWKIIDWKTSQKRPRVDWLLSRVQTRLYRMVLMRAGQTLIKDAKLAPDDITMNYWFAAFPDAMVSLPYDQAHFEADQTYLAGLITEIISKDPEAFIKTDDINQCRFCVYRSHCDRGVEAGSLSDFEDFSVEPEDFDLEINFDEIAEIKF
jgi:predicted RecB family nuclease